MTREESLALWRGVPEKEDIEVFLDFAVRFQRGGVSERNVGGRDASELKLANALAIDIEHALRPRSEMKRGLEPSASGLFGIEAVAVGRGTDQVPAPVPASQEQRKDLVRRDQDVQKALTRP